MANSEWVVDVTEANFATAVLERSKSVPVVIDFWATWCQPCRMLGPVLESLAEEYAGKFVLAKLDTDANPALAMEFQVSSIPLVMAMVGGKIVGQFVGAQPESRIRAYLDQIIPSEADRLLSQAQSTMEMDGASARAMYEEVLELDPQNSMALAALAELCLQAGDEAQAAKYAGQVKQGSDGWQKAENVAAQLTFRESARHGGSVEQCRTRVEADPGDLAARLDLANAHAASGDWRDALENLVTVVEKDRQFGSGKPRETMLQIFQIVGPQSQLANEYRSRLSRALY